MEPEGSLPSSQELSTCIYPEPDQSSPKHSILTETPGLVAAERLGQYGHASELYGYRINIIRRAVVLQIVLIVLFDDAAHPS
jgi:hypothetical protein